MMYGVRNVVMTLTATSEGGDDEGEFTYLHQGETGLQRHSEGLSGKERTEAAEEDLSKDDHQRDDGNRQPILQEQGRVDHHADRHEEDRAEDVLDRLHEMLDAFCINGLCQHRAHDESTQRAAESCLHSQQHHAKTESNGEDGQRLVVEVLLEFLQERRDEQDAHDKPDGDVHDQLAHLPQEFLAFKLVLHGNGGEQHHEHHREEVFHDEDAETDTRKAMAAESCLLNGFEHDGGGGHTQHTSQEQGVHASQTQEMSRQHTRYHHAHHNDTRTDDSSTAHFQQFLERELQSETEQEEEYTNLAPCLHVLLVGHPQSTQHVRSHQHTCHDVTQHDGLFECLEYQAGDASRQHNDAKVLYHTSSSRFLSHK